MNTHNPVTTTLTYQQMSHIESSVEIIRSDLFSLKDEALSETASKRVDQLLSDADDLYRKLMAITEMS